MHLKLVSFDICPYVQRSVITLKYKNVDHDVEYIDLSDKPDWFLKLSPLGKVPIMIVDGDEDKVLFESAVINEFADEISGGGLLPDDPFEKAKARAWIDYAGGLIMHFYQAITATDEQAYIDKKNDLIEGLLKMKSVVKGPFYSGESFSLVDSSIAPLFMRMEPFGFGEEFKKRAQEEDADALRAWYDALNDPDKDYIQKSLPADFYEKTLRYLEGKDSYYVEQIAQKKAA